MNWEKIYNDLIESRKSRGLDKKLLEGYYERHHKVPKCLGGNNDKDNLVLLTYREHVIAHKLLCLIHPNNQALMKALTRMILCEVVDDKGAKVKRELSAKEAQEIRELYIKSLTGAGNPNYGKTGVNASHYGKPLSEEAKKKISNANKGRLVGEKNPMYGVRLTGNKNPMFGKMGKDHPAAKRVIDPNGVVFLSLGECAEFYKCDRSYIRKKIKDPNSGFKLDPTNKNKKGDI